METWMIILIICLLSALLITYLIVYYKDKRNIDGKAGDRFADSQASSQLKLQAYERLVLLTDRIALPNLISRMNVGGLNAREMQLLLIQTIKQEFEHNVTQQLYVSAPAWEAVKNLKEQNMLIINQVGSFLPVNATGADLNKALMDLLMENPQASLNTIVSEALSFEAKKVIG